MVQITSQAKDKRPRWIAPGHYDETKFRDASLLLTPTQRRIQLLRLRLEDLERDRANLQPDQKWPTPEAIKKFKDKQNQEPEQKAEGYTKTPRAPLASDFPFPITKRSSFKRPRKFPRFSELPYELRHMIWEMALNGPNFIETQFCTDFQNTLLINHAELDEPLKLVCRESREIAFSSPLVKSSKVYLRLLDRLHLDRSDKQASWNEGSVRLSRRISFVPERDTIFLRSWDATTSSLYRYLDIFQGQGSIRHLALPFSMARPMVEFSNRGPLPLSMRRLETLTFMLGCEEKDRKAGKYVELRDVEEWFADGRWRKVQLADETYDIADLPSQMSKNARYWGRNVKVRFVAWKKVA